MYVLLIVVNSTDKICRHTLTYVNSHVHAHVGEHNVVHLYKVTSLYSKFWLRLCISKVQHVKFSKGTFSMSLIRRMKGRGEMLWELL